MKGTNIDTDLMVGGYRPLEGTSSFSIDESTIVEAKYEGGDTIESAGDIKVNFKMQIPNISTSGEGMFNIGVTSGQEIDFNTHGGQGTAFTLYNCKVVCSPSWNNTYGFCTDVSISGSMTEPK